LLLGFELNLLHLKKRKEQALLSYLAISFRTVEDLKPTLWEMDRIAILFTIEHCQTLTLLQLRIQMEF